MHQKLNFFSYATLAASPFVPFRQRIKVYVCGEYHSISCRIINVHILNMLLVDISKKVGLQIQ